MARLACRGWIWSPLASARCPRSWSARQPHTATRPSCASARRRARSRRCATRSRGSPERSRRAACATAIASRSWRRTGSRSSTRGSPAPGSARSSSRSTRRPADRSCSTSSTDSAPRVLIVEARFLEHLDVLERVPPELERLWLLDQAPGGDYRGLPLEAFPEPAGALEAADVKPGDTVAILYTSGTTGPSKGVMCPQAQFYWWARSTAAMLGGLDERRRALHVPAALPHERAERVHPGAQPRRGVRRRRALLGVALLGPRARRRRDRDLPARRDGLDPLEDRQRRPPRSAHRVRVALAPATPTELHELFLDRFGVAPARRLRHDRDERGDRRARRRSSAPGRWGARCRATRSRSSTRTTRRCPTAPRASS